MAYDIQEIESNVFNGELEKNESGTLAVSHSNITVKYKILSDDAQSAPLAAYQAFANFALQKTYNGLRPVRVELEEDIESAGTKYDGAITYKSEEESDSDEGGDEGDLSDLPAAFSCTTETSYVDVPFVRDVRTGQPVVNSAGQPFNPPLMRQELIITLTITNKQYSEPNISLSGTINTAPFLGAPPGTVLLESLTSNKGETDKKWTVKRKYSYKPSGWAVYVLDTGTMERTASGLRAILDDESHAVQEPVKLDGSGRVLANQSSPGVLLGPFWGYH